MSVFERDAAREAREQEIRALIKKRDKITAEINRCKEAGPLMAALCRELTEVKKDIKVLRGL